MIGPVQVGAAQDGQSLNVSLVGGGVDRGQQPVAQANEFCGDHLCFSAEIPGVPRVTRGAVQATDWREDPKLDEAHKSGDMKKMFATDTVPWGARLESEHPWYTEVTVAPFFAEVIFRINHKRSVSELLR